MRARDLAIVGAVVLIAGFAAADALRSRGGGEPSTAPTSTPETGTEAETGTIERELRQFEPVPAPGSIVFTDGDDCHLREVSVGTGLEFPFPRIVGDCRLWASPLGERIAYGLGGSFGEAVPFRFLDLNHPRRDLGAFQALFGFIAWSPDGQRAAWCDDSRTGYDYELGGRLRELELCPRGYTPDSNVAYLDDRRLVSGGRTIFTAPAHIDAVSTGRDGSIAVSLDGGRIQRRHGGTLRQDMTLPRPLAGRPLVFAPDNCAALVVRAALVHLVDVGCFRGPEASFSGTAAAWSPNGEWIAVADGDAIALHRVVGARPTVRWNAAARALAWH